VLELHHKIIYFAIPGFVVTMALESWWDRRKSGGNYVTKDALTSLGLGLGFLVMNGGWGLLTWAAYSFGYEHRVFTMPLVWWSIVLLVFLDDHSYYWYHRMSHEIPACWAAHVAHHSSEHYTLATALRQPWTTGWYAWMFWTPLAFLGFHPLWILAAQAASLIYQYWIHTVYIHKLPVFNWVFNTPSHHRVHHGSNPIYIDRNHAGIFILWDRLYGTFEPESEPVRYGITKPVKSHNIVWLNLHEYIDLWKEARTTGSLRGGLEVFFKRRRRVQARHLPTETAG